MTAKQRAAQDRLFALIDTTLAEVERDHKPQPVCGVCDLVKCECK